MSAKILIVDDIPVNVTLLEAKLTAAYYQVLTASNGIEALRVAEEERPDLILLDVMMPEMDGYECCRRLKARASTAHIPVVMVTALDQMTDRVRGLEAGADDFLTKPPNDMALFARVRSLVRVKMMIDELRMRDDTLRELGVEDMLMGGADSLVAEGKVMIVEGREGRARKMREALSDRLPVMCWTASTRDATMAAAAREAPDVFVISNRLADCDGLRLCSELRSTPETRQSATIMIVDEGDFPTVAASLDVGASDYVMRPIDENELVARVKSQLLRKRYADRLRETVHNSVRMAATDGLTGLYNRRYADQHLQRQIALSEETGAPLSVMMLDLDKFKSINDTYGHLGGDDVLIETAKRVRQEMRGVDLVGRYGGEEFVAVLPETDQDKAMQVAERVRRAIEEAPFRLTEPRGVEVSATMSIGVATRHGDETSAELISRADAALYRSKRDGRNRVTAAARPSSLPLGLVLVNPTVAQAR